MTAASRLAARRAAGAAVLLIASGAIGGDYPRWRGPNSDGAADEPGAKLIDSWADARLLWKSEQKNPVPFLWRPTRGWPPKNLGNGGFAAPAIAGGRVYVAYWRPAGTIEGRGYKVRDGDPRIARLIDADDVIICIDAKTGRTVWKTLFRKKGINWCQDSYGGHLVPCVADGKVYAIGSIGRAYCVDAKTGRKIWDASTGRTHRAWERYKAYCLKHGLYPHVRGGPKKEFFTPTPQPHPGVNRGSVASQSYNVCPMVAAGVAVFGTPTGSLIGFDGQTGRQHPGTERVD